MNKSLFAFALFLIVSVFHTSILNAQLEFPEDKVNWTFTVEQNGDEATIVGTITMIEHWHIYAVHIPEGSFTIPTDVVLNKSANFKKVGKVIEPKPHFEHDDLADEDLYYHSNTIKLKQKIKILGDRDFIIKGVFSFQTCDDTHCLPPFETEFEVSLKGVEKENLEIAKKLDFSSIDGDETEDKDGTTYVKVNEEWYKVPAGNSKTFYKKYLSLGGKYEK